MTFNLINAKKTKIEKEWKKDMVCLQCGKCIGRNKRIVVGLNGYGPFCSCSCYTKSMLQEAKSVRGFENSDEYFCYHHSENYDDQEELKEKLDLMGVCR
jgi:hypothetical protein